VLRQFISLYPVFDNKHYILTLGSTISQSANASHQSILNYSQVDAI